MTDAIITKEEFCARFKARLLAKVGPKDSEGNDVAAYADETAPTYFEDGIGCELDPEAAADTDLSYWEPA